MFLLDTRSMVPPTNSFRETKSGASAIEYGLIAGLFPLWSDNYGRLDREGLPELQRSLHRAR